jgi:hypothetical protein
VREARENLQSTERRTLGSGNVTQKSKKAAKRETPKAQSASMFDDGVLL